MTSGDEPDPAEATLQPGDEVDHFKVVRLLGRGGMGVASRSIGIYKRVAAVARAASATAQ